MDASTIRLILIVVGAILIVALYLWERHRERRDGYHDDYEDDYLVEEAGADEPYGVRTHRREPALDLHDDEGLPEEDAPVTKPSRPAKSWPHSRTSLEPEVQSADTRGLCGFRGIQAAQDAQDSKKTGSSSTGA